MTEVLGSSNPYIGGEYAREADALPWYSSNVPKPFLPTDPETGKPEPLKLRVRPGVLPLTTHHISRLLKQNMIVRPIASGDIHGDDPGAMVIGGRSEKPTGDVTTFQPNETPPIIMEVVGRKGRRIGIFINAFPYGVTEVDVSVTSTTWKATVPILSLVAALYLDNPPLNNISESNEEALRLFLYTFGVASQLITTNGLYFDNNDKTLKTYRSVIVAGNISTPESLGISGGSIVSPHLHLFGYPKDYAPSMLLGLNPGEDGGNDRSKKMIARYQAGIGGAVIDLRKNAALYVPDKTAAEKAVVLRIAPKSPFRDWRSICKYPKVINDIAYLIHSAMLAMGEGCNLIIGQGEMPEDGEKSPVEMKEHIFAEVRSPSKAGGFFIGRPMFPVPIIEKNGQTVIRRFRPNPTYDDSIVTGDTYRRKIAAIRR